MSATAAGRPQPSETRIDKFLLFLEYVYLMRFPLIAGVLLAIVLPAGYYFAPAIFKGLFDAGGFWSFVFVTWMAFQLAWTVMVTSRLVLVYGPIRFESLARWGAAQTGELKPWHLVAFGCVALPTIAWTWIGSKELHAGEKLAAAAIGLAISLALLAMAAVVHLRIEHGGGRTAEKVLPTFGMVSQRRRNDGSWETSRSSFWKWMDTIFGALPENVTAGLMRSGTSSVDGKSKRWFRSGHELAFTAFVLLLVMYGVVGAIYSPKNVSPEHQPAALFYALFLFTLWTWFFYGVAFVLDRFRLPVLTTLLVISLATGFFRTDHHFRVSRIAPRPELSPSEVIKDWNAGPRGGSGKPITVIATAGGGIQAAAWTAQVFTGLQKECAGGAFASSVVLVSSVSGGSVGTMYAVAPFLSKDGTYTSDESVLSKVRYNASRSSLSSVGWGLLYPDLLRTLPFVSPLVPQRLDRGWAIENSWITGWTYPPNMSDWREDVRRGTRPAVIFNATAAESGERFLIGSTELANAGGMQFGREYKGWDVPVATAARLSATFPYVSPIARASAANDERQRVHLADGGYYDNSGLVGALGWLKEASGELQGRTVILLAIDSVSGTPKNGEAWSWQKQMVGPITTIVNMRTSSQQYRGKFEASLVKESLEAAGARVILAPFLYSGDTPLSWHLNPEQKKNVELAWQNPTSQIAASKNEVFAALGCRVETQAAKK